MKLILGIETSCDETAAAVVDDADAVRSNVVWSQHALHERYRGVVPEIASRAHLECVTPVIDEAVRQAGVTLAELDAIAVGNRPGLIGSLLVGVTAAQALAWSLNKPLVAVNHVHAHLYAPMLNPADRDVVAGAYPTLGLVVSGGHTSLYLVHDPRTLEPLGRTIDDAVGEAYDKAAVILGLGYPGGPIVDRLAKGGDPAAVDLPRSMLGDGLDFSFSGLKTAVLYAVRGQPVGRGAEARFERSADDLTDARKADLAASFQAAAIDALIRKLDRALQRHPETRSLILGGGVSANSLLRARAAELAADRGLPLHLPAMPFCVDNAAMIAGLGRHHLAAGDLAPLDVPAMSST
jgi:N6-L-threonylcarbamoyladenine synthase